MYKKDYRPDKEYKNTNIPGFNQDRLNPLSLRINSTAWSKIFIWSFDITSTWNISISWVWFKPKLVKFELVHNNSWFWSWNMTETSQNSTSFYVWVSTTRCIDIYNNLWILNARAVYVSMDNDWFTINVQNITPTLNVNFTAFW